ncbi:Unconventional myosin-VI, partial [Fragariocoptes setiger]
KHTSIMEFNKMVWVPDIEHGYVVGKVVDIAQDKISVEIQSSGQTLEFPYASVYPREADQERDVDDNCALTHLNEATLLENLRVRFGRSKIYTYVAHILIAVNPYLEIKGLHSPEAIVQYQGKSIGVMPPHVFAIADKAYRDMKAFKQSQSIIISGESGAGKTESQKYVLRYLCLSGSQSGRLEKLILDANPLLEAFGNAKTIRNNNSSRFGKFIEIHYNQKFSVTGGLFLHYLLEKSRICSQSQGERNYHIFYQMCCCLPKPLWQQLELGSPEKFNYLKRGCTQYFMSKQSDSRLDNERKSAYHAKYGAIQDQLIDDIRCFEHTERALENFGVNAEHKLAIYQIVAAVLHLGNISFEDDPDDNRGGCRVVAGQSEYSLAVAARLMGLDTELLRQCLASRVISTSRAGHTGTVYMVQLSAAQAQAARDALAKAIYSKLFDHIVTRIINTNIPFTTSNYYIGVLDVAGFEYFQHNSFEQFLINFCNEKLQQFFNQRILKEEQSIYEKEGLNLKRIEFIDNQDCLDLMETKGVGIFDLLDEESRLPKPSAQHFTQSVHTSNKNHFRLAVPRASKLKYHREIRDDEGFLIRHFAGAVCYETATFIEKNNDALHASLKNLMLDADNELLKGLFESSSSQSSGDTPTGSLSVNVTSGTQQQHTNKLSFISVGTTFRQQLNDLMTKLRSTGSHFIRCIKPNSEMVPNKFVGSAILSQLRCSGMNSVLELMQHGYPSRSSFNDLYNSYKKYLPAELARLDSHLFCRALFKAIGLSDADFRFGSSKVFFRPGKFAQFDEIIRSDGDHVAELVKKVSRWLACSRWRKIQYCALSVIKLKNKILYRRQRIINIQKHWRMALAISRYKCLLTSSAKAQRILKSLDELESIAKQLKLDEDKKKVTDSVLQFRTDLKSFINRIKASVNNDKKYESASSADRSQEKKSLQDHLTRLADQRDQLIVSIKDKIAKQEQLVALQQKMNEEARQRELELAQKEREQEGKRQRAEIEMRRQLELTKLSKDTAHNRSALHVKTTTTATETNNNQWHNDQEQRDFEIALRLARESDATAALNQISGATPNSLSPIGSSGTEHTANSPMNLTKPSGKYDLSKWKYSELRDTINTSCDLELLEACKQEFHRRLKVYHAWKSKHARSSPNDKCGTGEELRAPFSVMGAYDDSSEITMGNGVGNHEQRYFRIPFVKPSGTTGERGWWYAHFDGQWIARQLELHPNKEPILLVAGRDDMSMCELSLKETRLTSKRGAEILPQEFEEEWTKNGGKPYKNASVK